MGFPLIPQGVFRSIYHIDKGELVRQGIKLLLADLDNTLACYGQREPDRQLYHWVQDLKEHGIQVFILSNSRKPDRVSTFAGALGVPFRGRAYKPSRRGFLAALEQMGCRAEEALMVGDQIFTDILGANRMGIRAYLVEPLQLAGNPGRYLRYAVETPFRELGRKRGGR